MRGDTSPVDEAALVKLGIHRIALPIPFRDAGGPVNVYAIENTDGGWTLFDSGLGTTKAKETLSAAAKTLGIELSAVSEIIVSHGHLDHFGNAQELSMSSGAAVYLHAADVDKVCGDTTFAGYLQRAQGYLVKLGVDRDVVASLVDLVQREEVYARPVERSRLRPLEHGRRFRFRHFEAEVLHCPGHTPGLVCLHAPEHRLLFSNDHLLEKVSPNPLIDLSQGEGATKFKALVEYVVSAKRVHGMDLDAILPGHGPSFTGHRSLLDDLFDFYRRRQAKILARLRQSEATALEIAFVIFVRIDLTRLWLMLSEALANLEVLEAEGSIQRTERDGVFFFGVR
jgi:glyoxylase-like metal-dependent hydrolase (beta-lactamase superfamily II)